MAKSAILEPLGLITRPNQLGQYPDGACLVAHNVLCDGPGIMSTAPAWDVLASITCPDAVLGAEVIRTGTGYTLCLIKSASGWRYCWIDPAGAVSTLTTATNAYDSDVDFDVDGRIDWMLTRDRVFVTSSTGVMVFDYLSPSTDAERAPRLAGLTPPAFWATPDSSSGASAIKQDNHAHAVMTLTRHFPDCYEVTSPPSAAVQVRADGSDINIVWNALNRTGDPPMLPGDMIEVWRTQQLKAPKPGATPALYDPGVSTGSDYYLSSTFEVPTSGGFTWSEATGDQNLGESLYTNSGAIGASAQKRPPPICRAMATYRNYSFYFDVTEPAARVARAGAGVGELTDEYSRRWGIGTRTIACTYSSSSPTLTGISAADIIGLVVGMEVTMPDFSKRTITAVGSTTVTLSANPPSSGTGTLEANDVLEISGTKWSIENADAFCFIYGANFDDLSRVNPDTPGTKTTPATGFAPRYEWAGRGDMTLRATHGANYLPALPDLTATAEAVERPRRANGMGWTEQGQPEALTQYGIVGQGTVYAAVATSVSLIMFSSQGIHRLAGTGGSSSAGFDWSQDQIDSSVSLTGPRALCRLADDVYALTNVGAVVVTAGGTVQELSTSALGAIGGTPWDPASNARVCAEEGSGDVWFTPHGSTYSYVYSTRWNKWTTVEVGSGLVCASSSLQTGLTFGRALGNALQVIRKSTTSYLQPLVRFQPQYAGDPLSGKRWQEAEWLFGGGAAGVPVTLLVNELTGITRTLKMPNGSTAPTHIQAGVTSAVQGSPSTFALAMVSQEIPRNAPAVSYSITLGYTAPAGTTRLVFCGLGVSAVPIATLRRAR